MLEIRNLSVRYGPMTVLRDVSLEVKDRQVVSIIGPNGAGKTTLCHTVSGLVSPYGGSVVFDGHETTHFPPHRLVQMGMVHVPEGRHLFSTLTVYQNLILGCHAKRPKRAEEERLLEFTFSLFPALKDRLGQLAGSLSGGEQQMLAVGRGLMSQPRLFLLDEPSLGLAPILVKTLGEAFKAINEQGITLLLVEQNARLAISLSHEIYVLENGQVALHGSSDALAQDDRIKRIYLGG